MLAIDRQQESIEFGKMRKKKSLNSGLGGRVVAEQDCNNSGKAFRRLADILFQSRTLYTTNTSCSTYILPPSTSPTRLLERERKNSQALRPGTSEAVRFALHPLSDLPRAVPSQRYNT